MRLMAVVGLARGMWALVVVCVLLLMVVTSLVLAWLLGRLTLDLGWGAACIAWGPSR